MELKDLCGKHIFSGCQLCTEKNTDKYSFYDSCNVCLFTLDGITYKAIEDPDDGWRSYCSSIEISNVKPKYSFEGIEVDCSMKPDDINGYHNILVVKDTITEKVVLEVGTGNIGDWYPYCHFSYHPENMVCNQNR